VVGELRSSDRARTPPTPDRVHRHQSGRGVQGQDPEPNQLWQTDFTYLNITGWAGTISPPCSTTSRASLDDFLRFIVAWKLCATMKAQDITATNVELGKRGRWRSNVWTYPGVSSLGSDARQADRCHGNSESDCVCAGDSARNAVGAGANPPCGGALVVEASCARQGQVAPLAVPAAFAACNCAPHCFITLWLVAGAAGVGLPAVARGTGHQSEAGREPVEERLSQAQNRAAHCFITLSACATATVPTMIVAAIADRIALFIETSRQDAIGLLGI
jgi:hypothetical protein